MKKLLTIFLLLFSLSALADDIHSYHFYAAPIQLQPAPWDDTATLQALANGGPVVLPFGHAAYSVTSLNLTYSFDLNGNTINGTATAGACIKLMGAGARVSNGTIHGSWDYTTAYNINGPFGIAMSNTNTTVRKVHVTQFAAYGINCGPYSNLTIDSCTIDKTGYIGFYYDPETLGLVGGTFTNNTIDRSMISPATVFGLAVGIRGSTSSGKTINGWTITGNTIKMPSLPADLNSECMEIRFCNTTTIANNTFTGGSIGISCVHSTGDSILNNHITGTKAEAIEYGTTVNCVGQNNYVNVSIGVGELLDGAASGTIIKFDTVHTVGNEAIHTYQNTVNVTIIGCVLTTTSSRMVINIQNSDQFTLKTTSIDGGSHAGTAGIFFDTSPGNLTDTAGSISNCTYMIYASNSVSNAVVNHIAFTNTRQTATPTQKGSFFTNGAHYGSNITFSFNKLTFNTIASKTYGQVDFDPGATSSLTITYSSSNTAIATIVSGKIHVTGTGTVSITASTTDTSAVQPFTINKASLTITAANKSKNYGTANPSLTANYTGFQYGQTHTVLTSQPILSTAAGTFSLPGPYAITASGAAAANYTIGYLPGVLTINAVSTNYSTRKHGFSIKYHN